MSTILAGIGSVLGGLGGLFGSKPKQQKQLTPYQAMESQVKGARDHSEEYGFNPLTLLQYGATSGFGAGGSSGSAPPLASIAAITDGLKDISDVTSGDKARRDAREELENDLLKVQLENFRSGVLPSPVAATAVQSVSPGPSPFGRRSVVQPSVSASIVHPKFSQGDNPIAPGRKQDVAPLVNSPGVFEMENELTPFGPVTIPGEGEPWGIDELATGLVVGVPQIVGGALDATSQAVKDRLWDGKPALQYYRDKSAEKAETPEGKAKKTEFDRLLESQSYRNPYRNR